MSVSTVSLALSDKKSRVSAVTKQRVRAAAKEMNYRPNLLASGLITRKTKILGLILPDIINDFFAKVAKGAGFAADPMGYNLMLFDTNGSPDKDEQAIYALLEHGTDGILLTNSVVGHSNRLSDCLKECEKESVPILLVDRLLDDFEAHCLVSDQELGGYMATRHLLEYGHKRIGCITGPVVDSATQKRLYGYHKALKEFNIPFDPSLIVEGDYSTDCGYELVKPLLMEDVTAIFAFSDLTAYGAYRYLFENGIDVPGTVSLIGYDDLEYSRFMGKPLTTVRQPAYDIGRGSVAKLIRMINDEPVEKITILEPELVIRASTAKIF